MGDVGLGDLADDVLWLIFGLCDLETLLSLESVSCRCKNASRLMTHGSGNPAWRRAHRDEIQLDKWMRSAHRACKCERPSQDKQSAQAWCDGVRSVDLAGGWIAAAGGQASSKAHLWRLASYGSCRSLQFFSHDDDVGCVAIRPDGRQLATACRGGGLYLWSLDGATNSCRTAEPLAWALPEHDGDVFALTWIDVDTLLSGGTDRMLRCWCIKTHALLSEQRGSLAVAALACDVDGWVASAQRDNSIALLSGKRGPDMLTVHKRLVGHTKPVLAVAIGGGRVASGGCGGGIRLWDVTSGQCTALLASPTTYALGLHGRGMLVSGGCGETCVRVWQLKDAVSGREVGGDDLSTPSATASGRVVARLNRPEGGGGSPCALALDGDRVVSGDSAVGVPICWVVSDV